MTAATDLLAALLWPCDGSAMAPAEHCAGEDEQAVRWLTGGYGTVEGTAAYFGWLACNAAAGRGKRGFGVRLDGRLAGYVDCDPDVGNGPGVGDVNVSYAVPVGPAGVGWRSKQSG